jgi:hypothetical protein
MLFVMIMALLTGTRQLTAAFGIVTVLYVLLNKLVKNKVAIFILLAVGAVAFYFMFQEIIQNMIELSEKQSSGGKTDQRAYAIDFFFTEFIQDKWAYVVGNGPYSATIGLWSKNSVLHDKLWLLLFRHRNVGRLFAYMVRFSRLPHSSLFSI